MRTQLLCILATVMVLAGCSTSPSSNSQNELPIRAEILQEMDRYTQADTELNRIYNKVLNHYDKDRQELLRKAERAWIIMRDAQVELAVGRNGDWGRTAGYYNSLATLTEDRIRYLQILISDE